MPILGVGVDIVEVARFSAERLSPRFLQGVFTEAEREYCLSRPRPEQHLAVRFAAKEAAAKALSLTIPFVSVCQIEVIRPSSGIPSIMLRAGRHGEAVPVLPEDALFHVSLSHSEHYATAMVVLEACSQGTL